MEAASVKMFPDYFHFLKANRAPPKPRQAHLCSRLALKSLYDQCGCARLG